MFDVFAMLAVLVAVLVVWLAYDSDPDDAVTVWVDVTPLARAWRWARATAARVAGWLW